MIYFFVLIIALGLLVVIVSKSGLIGSTIDQQTTTKAVLPYRKRDFLLTKAERSFYEVLVLTARSLDVHIFAKVRLADLLYLPKDTANRTSFQNQINSKHIDFILCDKSNVRPLMAIELDDSSHGQASRQARDSFVNKALLNAGLPLLRVPAQHSYSVAEISAKIQSCLQKSEVAPTKK